LALDGGECSTVHPSYSISGERVPDTHKAQCTLELMRMILERSKCLASARNRTLSCLAISLLAVQTTVLQLFVGTRVDHC